VTSVAASGAPSHRRACRRIKVRAYSAPTASLGGYFDAGVAPVRSFVCFPWKTAKGTRRPDKSPRLLGPNRLARWIFRRRGGAGGEFCRFSVENCEGYPPGG
jgi:hypothetical protein